MADGSGGGSAERIAQIVAGMLAKRNIGARPALSEDLRAAGLTSLDLVNLMLAVEASFEVEIPEAMMTPDNFRSISAIEAVVMRLAA